MMTPAGIAVWAVTAVFATVIDILSEAGLCTERHRQAADDGPPYANGVEIRGGLPEDCVDGLHPALPACRQSQAIARLAARPAEPRLHPGLDLLIRGPDWR
jgi:hypothetical protein